MSVFQLGSVIKARREELGLSQEDLADGICSVPTLSRIENGERMPTKNHYERLMQRLGYDTLSVCVHSNGQEILVHELKVKLRQAYMDRNERLGRKYLSAYKKGDGKVNQFENQFLLLYSTVFYEQQYSCEELLRRYEDALKITYPKFSGEKITHILSFEEVVLLNNIAVCCGKNGDRNRGIKILEALREYYEQQLICTEEAVYTRPMILYHLSMYLGLDGRYDACIEVCDMAIQNARSTRRCTFLAGMLYFRGWAMLQRGRTCDRPEAQSCIRQAYYFAGIMGNAQVSEQCRSLWKTCFPGDELN